MRDVYKKRVAQSVQLFFCYTVSQDFFSRTAWWIFMKLGVHEVRNVPNKCCCFWPDPPGRIPGRNKIGHGGPFLQINSSLNGNATATNRMNSNDLDACGKQWVVLIPFQSPIFDAFWRLFGLGHIVMQFLQVFMLKIVLINIYFVQLPCFEVGKSLYKRLKCFQNFNDFYVYI